MYYDSKSVLDIKISFVKVSLLIELIFRAQTRQEFFELRKFFYQQNVLL